MTTRNDIKSHEYSSYYQNYIDKSGNLDLISGLKSNLEAITSFYESIPDEKLEYRYDHGKWTIKELIQHLIDAERIFAYRALRIAREDQANLHGFEQDDYVLTSHANLRSIQQLVEEYKVLRRSTILLFESLLEDDLSRIGMASGSPVSPRAIGFIIIGHENHHREIIEERYL